MDRRRVIHVLQTMCGTEATRVLRVSMVVHRRLMVQRLVVMDRVRARLRSVD